MRRPPEIGILVSPCALAAAAVRRWRAAAEEPKIGSGNVFAALETLKKKKKKPAAADKAAAKPAAARDREEGPKPEVFWAPAPLTAKSWADVDDDDDDDYFATTAPPPMPVWGDAAHRDAAKEQHTAPALEEVCLASIPSRFLSPFIYCALWIAESHNSSGQDFLFFFIIIISLCLCSILYICTLDGGM